MGLKNGYQALGDFSNSEFTFRETIRLHPWTGFAYNNVVQDLIEPERYPEAHEMVFRAVSIGGASRVKYQQTLKEIESKMSQ
jgi:hypothetical protein